LKKGAVLNVNLKFVTNTDQVQLNRNDSLLLIGKAKDLRQVNHQHLSKQLTGLQIPQQVKIKVSALKKLVLFLMK
jgi:hypothetical protein